MFKNVGEKIKGFAKGIFIVLAISAFVSAIVIWSQDYLDGKFWIGLGEFIGGLGVAAFFSYMIYGFGIIVNSHEGNSGEAPVETSAAPVAEKKVEYNSGLFREAEQKREEAKKPAGTPLQGEWKCSKCGRINQDYVGTCGCGQRKP